MQNNNRLINVIQVCFINDILRHNTPQNAKKIHMPKHVYFIRRNLYHGLYTCHYKPYRSQRR